MQWPRQLVADAFALAGFDRSRTGSPCFDQFRELERRVNRRPYTQEPGPTKKRTPVEDRGSLLAAQERTRTSTRAMRTRT